MDMKLYETVKKELIQEIKGMRELNKTIKTSGERMDIPVGDRNISAVYFKSNVENAPLIIGFHGGGYMMGGHALNDRLWTRLRDELKANIVSVDYRKSPEYRWREALDDAFDAARYFNEHAGAFGFDKDRIWVMGASAGAGLAATLCIYAKQKGESFIKKQILMYPFLDLDTDPDSKGEGSLSGPLMYIFNELHCKKEEARLPLVSPVFASKKDLEGLPEAILCMADYDNLKHEGFQYAEMLREAGVEVESTMIEGMPHGFIESGFGGNFPGEFDFLSDREKADIRSGKITRGSMEAIEFIKNALY